MLFPGEKPQGYGKIDSNFFYRRIILPMTKGCPQTRLAMLWTNLASEPLLSLYTLLPFILRKEYVANVFQLSIFLTLRPVLSLLSFCWSAYFKKGKSHLIANLVSAFLLTYLPFVFLPWIENFSFFLFAAASYQLFSKAAIPSLIEIIKCNIPKKPREDAFSLYYLFGFIESGILGLLFAYLLRSHIMDWKTLFSCASLLGLSSVLFFRRIPTIEEKKVEQPNSIQPWKESFYLLHKHKSFRYLQWIFMFGGSSLMLMGPAFSSFYVDTLSLSYTNMATARFVFMALGVAGSTFLWKKGLRKCDILKLSLWVLIGMGIFPIMLLFAQIHIAFLYLAFMLYGVAQAGSHLIWNLSGTIFAGEHDSSPFTRANILLIGIRGIVMPLLGGLLCQIFGDVFVLALGGGLCLMGLLFVTKIAKIKVASLTHLQDF